MFAILGIDKIKTLSQLIARCSHHLRTHAVPNANDALFHQNACAFKGTGKELATEIWEKVEPLVKRKDAIRTIEVMLSISPEFFEKDANKSASILTKSAVQFLGETFGATNIAGIGLHRDEKTPHIWALITPIDGGVLRAAHWTDGPAKMQKLHTAWAKKLEPFGVKRGVQKSKANHIDLRTYYAAVNGDLSASSKLEREMKQRLFWAVRRISELEFENLELQKSLELATRAKSITNSQLGLLSR